MAVNTLVATSKRKWSMLTNSDKCEALFSAWACTTLTDKQKIWNTVQSLDDLHRIIWRARRVIAQTGTSYTAEIISFGHESGVIHEYRGQNTQINWPLQSTGCSFESITFLYEQIKMCKIFFYIPLSICSLTIQWIIVHYWAITRGNKELQLKYYEKILPAYYHPIINNGSTSFYSFLISRC